MDYRQYLMIIKLLILLFLNIVPQNVSCNNLWHIVSNDSIVWENINVSHKDHLEMSGLMISSIVHYGIDETGRWMVDRELIWPSLRVIPNDTYGSLKYRFRSECLSYLLVDKSNLSNEKVISISLSGVISVESLFKENGVKLKRILFPSVDEAAFCEYYEIVNISDKNIEVEMPNLNVLYKIDSIKGVYGSYNVKYYTTIADNIVTLFPNDIISFGAVYQAFKENDSLESINVYNEYIKRKSFLKEIENNLTLETPDNVINTMFNFAKIRASESIYKTKGGFLHGPGGGVYYAAVWANDQAEYVNPFFPFLGYDIGNKSAMDSFRLYMRYMNDDYKPLPSSIIAEGDDIWNGAGDRGDAAMIAYGAARYALASGNKDEANELWPLIKWCLEYCKRKLNKYGVVSSDTDELENRFPSGNANLCTSSLYYDALVSASYLANELDKSDIISRLYMQEAENLKENIIKFFSDNIEGYETYRYYEGNDVLRSWICIPMTMGIYDRKEGTINALFSERLWTKNGLLTQAGTKTYWDRSTLYALRGVFASGERDKALEYFENYSNNRLLGEHVPYAIEAWPEGNQRHLSAESGLYARIITEGVLGIRPIGMNSFSVTPQLPLKWNFIRLKNIRAFNRNFTLEFIRNGNKIKMTLSMCDKKVFTKNVDNGSTIVIRL